MQVTQAGPRGHPRTTREQCKRGRLLHDGNAYTGSHFTRDFRMHLFIQAAEIRNSGAAKACKIHTTEVRIGTVT